MSRGFSGARPAIVGKRVTCKLSRWPGMLALMDTPIRFTLCPPALGRSVSIALRRAGERWVAQVEGAGLAAGMGSSAGAALGAAIEPLGSAAVSALLADLGLLEPSLQVLELERAPGG